MPKASGMRVAFIVTSAVSGSRSAGCGCCALMTYSIVGYVAWTPRPGEDRITLSPTVERCRLRSWSDRNVVALPACEAASKKRPLSGVRQPVPGECPRFRPRRLDADDVASQNRRIPAASMFG